MRRRIPFRELIQQLMDSPIKLLHHLNGTRHRNEFVKHLVYQSVVCQNPTLLKLRQSRPAVVAHRVQAAPRQLRPMGHLLIQQPTEQELPMVRVPRRIQRPRKLISINH